MKHQAVPSRRRRSAALAVLLTTALAAGYAVAAAQSAKKVLSIEDYSKWRTISGQEISGDGNWVTYGQALTNTATTEAKPVLHLVRVDTNQHVEVPNGSGGVFSADSKWSAYQVDPTGGRGGRGGAAGTEPAPGGDTAVPPGAPGPPPANPAQQTTPPGQNPPTTPTQPAATPPAPAPPAAIPAPAPSSPPTPQAAGAPGRGAGATPPAVPTRVELRNLSTGALKSWQDIQSFMFSANSTHLVLRRKAPTPAGGAGRGAAANAPAGATPAAAGAPPASTAPRGTDVILHNLVSGRDQLLGSVGDIAFNKSGELLAYTVDA
ncbi:MAG: hypothetical protein ABIQ52_18285, partial [Vicinamibacterales bacterium]